MATTDSEATGTVADPSEHLRELLQFVIQHRWVHDIQLTRFMELKWWERIPEEVGQISEYVMWSSRPAKSHSLGVRLTHFDAVSLINF